MEIGSTNFSIASWSCSHHGSSYLHVKLPLKVDRDRQHFLIRVRGYAFWEKSLLEACFAGYCFSGRGAVVHRATQGSHEPFVYAGSDKFVYCRLKLKDKFGCSLTVDSTVVGLG